MMQEAAPGLFEESGIKEVEDKLLKFLYSFAGRLQMLGSLDDIEHHLTQACARAGSLHPPLRHWCWPYTTNQLTKWCIFSPRVAVLTPLLLVCRS